MSKNKRTQNRPLSYLSRKEYTKSTGALNKTVTYTYGDDDKSGWNNLLTAVDVDGNSQISDSETITYDEIGNPEKYLGAELEWNGRQLTSYKTSDKKTNQGTVL